MQIPSIIPAALIAISLAGAAQAAAPAVPAVHNTTVEIAMQQDSSAPAVADNADADIQPADPRGKNAAQADAAAQPVPEPQVFLMMLAGLVLLGFASSRREEYEKFTD
jgi:hypothetical protein